MAGIAIERLKPPVVKDEQVDAGKALHARSAAAVSLGQRQPHRQRSLIPTHRDVVVVEPVKVQQLLDDTRVVGDVAAPHTPVVAGGDGKSTRRNSSHYWPPGMPPSA